MPVKGRLRLPDQPEQPAEVAERASRRSYVRRLLDLEAERARLRHDAGVRADQEALQAEQKRREQVRAEASSAPKRRPPARELPASATRARAELPHAVLVAVPEGLRGGMIMQVPVAPEGRAVEAEIPEGLGPGDEFYIGGGKDRPPVKQVTREQAAGAAVAIQSASRGHQARIRVSTQHAERREAAVRLQALLRGRQARSDIDTTKQLAATKMQAHYRGWQAREDYYDLLDQTVAAEHIQAVVRGTQTRQRASEQQAAAVAIQSRFRGNQERMLLSLPLRTVVISRPAEGGFGLSLTVGGESCVVESVRANSAADAAGIRAGDCITRIGEAIIVQADDAEAALGAVLRGDDVEMELLNPDDYPAVGMWQSKQYFQATLHQGDA
jgi:hypothetical protein